MIDLSKQLLQQVCATNPIVFFDINIGQEFAGRLIIELRKDVVPKTAENFRALCTGERGLGQLGKPLHYKGVCFHKVKRVYVAQSGDVVKNNGSSGESIYGPIFEDENFELLHDEGVVSMANFGVPNSNNSQFFITSIPCENLNGTNVVVGRVLRGLGIIGEMEQYTTDEGKPTEDIIIADCGEILPGVDWGYADNDRTDDALPPFPQDWEMKLNDFGSNEMLELLLRIRKAGNQFFAEKHYYDARRKYRKANRYYALFRPRFVGKEEKSCKKNSDNVLRQIEDFFVINNVNMAATELQLKSYAIAKYSCNEALRVDDKFHKAYYRRALAEIALKNYDEAINDLKIANELLPGNKNIINELNRAHKLLADYNRSQMEKLKNLFK